MAFWRDASVAAGKPEHALRQMCSAYDFVRAHAPGMPPEFAELALARPYTHLELLTRIAEADFERAVELIFAPGNVQSVRDLRKVLDDVRSKSGDDVSALVEGHKARKDILAIVAEQLPKLIAPPSVQLIGFRKWPGSTVSVSPSLVAIQPRIDEAHDVIGVLVSIKPNIDALHRAIARTGWESTFFDTYWLVVPASVASEADAQIRQFGLPNVGLVMFDTESFLLTLLAKPTERAPAPDRRSLLYLPEQYRR